MHKNEFHGSSAGALCLFQAAAMTNETNMFFQSYSMFVKAEPFYRVTNVMRGGRSQLLCTHPPSPRTQTC